LNNHQKQFFQTRKTKNLFLFFCYQFSSEGAELEPKLKEEGKIQIYLFTCGFVFG